jgi:CelD/BcsL family acetyltransferase involved in cellulose biosynthesis
VDYGPRRLGARELARRNLAWLRGRGLASDRRDGTRGPPAPPSRQFELGEPGRPPAAASGMLLRRVLDTFAADRRRAHYALLLDELGERVPPPFDRLPAGAAPFAFPLESHDKPREVARLAERGIEALDFWSAGHPALAGDAFPEVAARRATTIALPVHQELRPADVEAIADAARGGTPPRRGLRLEPLPLDAVSPGEWNALALAAGNVFGTWEWVSAWWRHLGGGAEWMATACRAPDGRLVGILPLCRTSRRRLRALEFLGNGPADRLGPLCAPADRPRVARAFAASLDRRRWPCDLLLGQYLPREEGWTAALGATIQASEPEAALDLAGRDWEAVTGGWSRKVRKGLAYSERRLVQDHGAGFRLLTDRPGLERQLDTLFALHAARWEGERSLFLEQQAFHRDFALAAADAGWARLWLLEADGRPVAAWYSLRFAGAEWLYQSGRDPAWDRRSVGAVLLVHAIREAHRDGVPEFRFLGGDQEYKRRLSNRAGTVDVVARAAGPAGEAALAARAAKHLLKAWTPRRRSPAPASA